VPRGLIAALVLAGVVAMGARASLAGDVTLDLRDASGKPLADAVIYAMPSKGAVPALTAHSRAIVDQVNKEFVPRVSVVQVGTEIQFPNSDNIRHSIYSFSAAKVFATKLYSGRDAAPVLFDKTGLIVLGCNIHDSMVAWVVVVDTPWFAKSGADGSATIRDLPPGDYQLTGIAPEPGLTAPAFGLHVESAPLRQALTLEVGA
jgi:plastocyanin